MSSALQAIPAEVLELLALPALEGLTDGQVRGAECVWCKERLSIETAVDLGEHQAPRWFPRACSVCAGERAHKGLFAHAPMCEQCVEEPGGCEVGRWLYRLVRENRR